MTSTTTEPAVRYERDAGGVVTLTLDDPGASANTMNASYRTAMHDAVDRLYDEVEDVVGVVVTSAKKTSSRAPTSRASPGRSMPRRSSPLSRG